MLRVRLLCLFLVLFVSPLIVSADNEADLAASALHPINDFDWTQMAMKIVDPDGKPIQGAQIRFTALGTDHGYGWWSDPLHGVPPIATSDIDGVAKVFLPNSIHPLEKNLVKTAAFDVKHPEFSAKSARLEFQRNDHVPEVQLQRGVRLRIAGVLPRTNQPLPHCHVLLERGEVEGPEFFADDKGWLNSVTISPTRRWFRVVHALPGQPFPTREQPNSSEFDAIANPADPRPGQPIQFSRLQSWDPQRELQEYRVEVYPGVRVVGKMPDMIPRPIRRGCVVVCCGSVPRADDGDGEAASAPVWWDDVATIQPDGRFEFPSLPAGHVAQIFAFADDWVSSQPTEETFESLHKWYPTDTRKGPPSWFRYGQVLRLVGKSQQLELNMEQAGSVKVHCMDANQRPLPGIVVSFWPNQVTMGGRGGIFCEYSSTRDLLHGRQAYDVFRSNPFRAESGSDGIAIVPSVPADNQSIHVGTDIWTSRADRWGTAQDREDEKIKVSPGETIERSFTLKRLN